MLSTTRSKTSCPTTATIPSRRPDDRGFTLVELLVTLSVLGIVIAVAAPSFTAMIERHQTRAASEEMLQTFNYARSMAVAQQQPVVVCSTTDKSTCSTSEDWSGGGMVFADRNTNGQRENDEVLLRVFGDTNTGSTLVFRGGATAKYLRFKPNGELNASGHFAYCPASQKAADGWTLIFHIGGRPYFGRDMDEDGVAEDGSGNPLAC